MATRIRLRRGTSVQWTSANPTLSLGEFGYETNTSRFKIGDGTTSWNELAYNDPLITLTGDVLGSGRGAIQTLINSVTMPNAKIKSNAITINQNNTSIQLDSFFVTEYTTAEYLIQKKQANKISSSKIMIMWDGTDLSIHEYAIVEGQSGVPSITITASHLNGTVALSATSPNAESNQITVKLTSTYIEA